MEFVNNEGIMLLLVQYYAFVHPLKPAKDGETNRKHCFQLKFISLYFHFIDIWFFSRKTLKHLANENKWLATLFSIIYQMDPFKHCNKWSDSNWMVIESGNDRRIKFFIRILLRFKTIDVNVRHIQCLFSMDSKEFVDKAELRRVDSLCQ